MNKEKLFSLVPTVKIEEKDIAAKIEEQKGLVQAGQSFASQLSINRHMFVNLPDFDIEERVDLFKELNKHAFDIGCNELYLYEITTDTLSALLKEKFGIEDIYQLDNIYIENLLNGRNIVEEIVDIEDEEMRLGDVLRQFVFQTNFMDMGDKPPLMLMLTVKKALLGSYMAGLNVESLQAGKKEMYDVSVLM